MPTPEAAAQASRRMHWNNHVTRHAHSRPDRPAFRFRGASTTWRELRDRVACLAGAMEQRGVSFGDRVAVLMGNRPEFMEVVLAANLLGAIAVPVNFRLSGPEIAYVLDNSGARLLVADDTAEKAVRAAVEQTSERVAVVAVGSFSGAEIEPYDALLAEAREPTDPPDVPEDSPALIMYTSGTTGRPKGAVLSHQNLLSETLTLIRAYQLTEEDEVNLVASPMFHIGAIGSIAPLITVGGTMVVLPSVAFDAGHVLELLEEERVTSAFLVPTQWQALCADPSLADRDLSRLRVTSWGAAPATDKLLRRMAEVFPDALNVAVFGQTEMSPITCVLGGGDALRKIGSVGKPVSGVAIRVVDGDLKDVPQGEIGEIVYQGTGLMEGYWDNPEATADAFAGGWFHSGDLVRMDDEGFLYVVDRAKDMIISGGENIYCAEVENVLADHPDIAEVSLVGIDHEKWGETPVAVVTLARSDSELDIAGLREWGSERLAKYKLPTALKIVDELPRNASGKVLKPALRELVG